MRVTPPDHLTAAYETHGAAMRRLAAGLLRGTGVDPEDVVHDVFLRARGAIGRPDAGDLRALLLQAVRNRCIDEHRRLARVRLTELDERQAAGTVAPHEAAVAREELRLLVDDIGHLPDRQRAVLVAKLVDGASHERIAAAHDVSVTTSRALLARAVANLRATHAARATACAEIRAELATARHAGVRMPERARRHLWTCPACAARRAAAALTPGWLTGLAEQLAGPGAAPASKVIAAGVATTALLAGPPAPETPRVDARADAARAREARAERTRPRPAPPRPARPAPVAAPVAAAPAPDAAPPPRLRPRPQHAPRPAAPAPPAARVAEAAPDLERVPGLRPAERRVLSRQSPERQRFVAERTASSCAAAQRRGFQGGSVVLNARCQGLPDPKPPQPGTPAIQDPSAPGTPDSQPR